MILFRAAARPAVVSGVVEAKQAQGTWGSVSRLPPLGALVVRDHVAPVLFVLSRSCCRAEFAFALARSRASKCSDAVGMVPNGYRWTIAPK